MSASTTTAQPSGATAANAEEAGRRVEEIIDHLTAEGDSEAAGAAEELVRVLMDFYGTGLARMVSLLETPKSKGDPFAALLDDAVVTSLLVLHDLHPEETSTRIARALDSVRSHPVELVSFDETTGTLHLRSAESSGCGCASTAAAGRQEVEAALSCFAPEVTTVEIEGAAPSQEPPLLQISRSPSGALGSAPASPKTP
ncbi:NifU family protein [Streptomyces sp. NPDC056121]|uniref:NifU family protein n=1 Tax=Streptomyces TaxID=1883 RepID=UPI001D09EA4C|nr:NifU family protein [Streptomyces longhuiensis]UDM04378.1 NifU family protein [Streptomyces longhuiensis]